MKSRSLFLVVSILAVLSMLITACGAEPTATTVPAVPTNTAAAAVATNTSAAAAPTATTAAAGATATTGGATNPTDTTTAGGASTPTEAAMAGGTATTAGGATTPAATAAAGATAGTTGTPAPPTSTPKPGQKVLRWNIATEPPSTDPQKNSFVHEIAWAQLNFEGLYELSEKNDVLPAAADGPPVVSADGKTFTVAVKDGLKYSDGTPLTAKDFNYAWHRLFDPNVPNRSYPSVAYIIKGSQELSEFTNFTDTAKLKQLQDDLGVKLVDAKHIQFTLTDAAPYFPYILALWVGYPTREDMVKAGGDNWTEPKTYIGNGPFILREWNHGNGAVWEANPNYRKGVVKIDRMEIREINESAVAFQAYKNGELDFLAVAPEDLKAVQGDPTLKSQYTRSAGNCTWYIEYNIKKPPFDNLKVRQAFARAIDRESYVEVVQQGAGQPALSMIPPGRPGYEESVKAPDVDPAGAKKLLADAGFPDGKGLPPIKLTYGNTARGKTHTEFIQNEFKTNLGLDLPLDPVDRKALVQMRKKNETLPQMTLAGWCQDYPDPQDWLSVVFRSDSAIEPTGWKNDQFDSLTKQADVLPATQQTQRLALYKQAQQILVDDAPVIFLYWDVADFVIKPYMQGMKEHISPSDQEIPGFSNILNIQTQK